MDSRLRAQGKEYEIVVLEEIEKPIDKFELPEAERFYIAYFKSIGMNLTNMSDGGEGNTGWKASKETKLRMANAQRGKKHTPETCAKIAENTRKQMAALTAEERTAIGRRLAVPTEIRAERTDQSACGVFKQRYHQENDLNACDVYKLQSLQKDVVK